jgi:lipoate-protein ligase A
MPIEDEEDRQQRRKFREELPLIRENVRRNEEYFRLKVKHTAFTSYRNWLTNMKQEGRDIISYAESIEVLEREIKNVTYKIRNTQAIERVITQADIGKQAIIYNAFIPEIALASD